MAHHDSGLLGMLRESQEKRGLRPAEQFMKEI